MKTLKLIKALFIPIAIGINYSLSIINCSAAVLTVNNSPTGGAQFAEIDPAISAAAAGDTIYVSGSQFTYSNATITKSLTLIGSGTFSARQAQFPTSISVVFIATGISNISIKGFKITNSIYIANSISYITISDNYFTSNVIFNGGVTGVHDIVISNNVHTGSNFFMTLTNAGSCYNFLVENNLINGSIQNFNFPSSTIQNNTFYNCGNAFNNTITVVLAILIKNNIFYNSHPTNATSNCTFLNNITYNTAGTYPPLGGTNIDNTDPQLINVGTSGGYNTSYNFSVPTTSPAHNAGTDGTDLGFYGGGVKVSVLGELQNVPVVRQMDVVNTNVLQNGNMNVKVRSTKAR